jgi:hypothetical protein
MGYGVARILECERNAARPTCVPAIRMFSVTALLAALFGLGVAAYMAVRLPAWAALCIALGAVVLVTIGGGALLAKALVFGALVLLAGRFMRRRER